MTTASAKPVTSSAGPPGQIAGSARDIAALLAEAARERRDDSDYYRHAMALVSGWLDAPIVLLDVRSGGRVLELQQIEASSGADDILSARRRLLLDTGSSRQPSVREIKDARLLLLTAPLDHARGGQAGAMLVAVRESRVSPSQLLRELQSFAALMMSLRAANEAQLAPASNVQRALERASKYESTKELAFSLVNSLAQRLQMHQVSLGVVKQNHVQLEAISGLDRFSAASPRVSLLRQAMGECLDAAAPICADNETPNAPRVHLQYRNECGAAVLSVPLMVDNECTAVATFERESDQAYDAAEVAEIQQMAGSFSPAIHLLKRLDSAGGSAKLLTKARQSLPGSANARRALAIAAATALLWFCFGTLSFQVRCDGELAPGNARVVAAPFDGVLMELLVRPGDAVQAGQPIARLDTRELTLERERLQSELVAKQMEISQRLGDRQSDLAALISAQAEALAAELAVAEQRIEQAEVRSTVNGVVLRGDWEQRVGQRVAHGAPLVEVGDGLSRVEIQIPERLATEIDADMSARFVPLADPARAAACRVTRVHRAAEPIEGETVVLAEAEFDAQDWAPAGMRGVVRINAGPRRVWWITLRPLIQWVQRGWA